jgi:hypothetical protein
MVMRYPAGVILLVALASSNDAYADDAPTLYVTRGAPLAIVDAGGEIRSAKCSARKSKRKGNRVGDEWTRVDASGRAAEMVRVTDSSVYDLSRCREIATTGRADTDEDPALYVRGPRMPSRASGCPSTPSSPPSALPGAIVFCTKDARGHETMRAVSGGTSLRFAHFDRARGEWRIDRTTTAPANDQPMPAAAAFKIVAVLDMNGDGSPEIVVHSRTSDAYADTVYTLDSRTGIVRAVAETSSGYA